MLATPPRPTRGLAALLLLFSVLFSYGVYVYKYATTRLKTRPASVPAVSTPETSPAPHVPQASDSFPKPAVPTILQTPLPPISHPLHQTSMRAKAPQANMSVARSASGSDADTRRQPLAVVTSDANLHVAHPVPTTVEAVRQRMKPVATAISELAVDPRKKTKVEDVRQRMKSVATAISALAVDLPDSQKKESP